MTTQDFLGCTLLAFGPPLAMFLFSIIIEPIRIIMLVISAFFWLLSFLTSSIVWYSLTPLQAYPAISIIYSVIFQETFRYKLYMILRITEQALEKIVQTPVAEHRHVFAYVCGLGFGLMSGVFSSFNNLADVIGPGTMGLHQGNEYFFLVSAATTLCFVLLHTFWGIIFFSALDNKNWLQVAWVVGSHFFASSMTILNKYNHQVASLFSVYSVLLVTTVVAFRVAGGRIQNLVRCIETK